MYSHCFAHSSDGFNSQPPEGGWAARYSPKWLAWVSTHSRPKAAGQRGTICFYFTGVSTHSRPKAAGACQAQNRQRNPFQLTAARRRLGRCINRAAIDRAFQLTAARRRLGRYLITCSTLRCFNSQPPEGGWLTTNSEGEHHDRFNSQPPEGGWWMASRLIMST